MASEIADRVDADDDWLHEAVLGDIARREAELAAWIEVAGAPDPLWIRAVAALKTQADFDATADTALEAADGELELLNPLAEAESPALPGPSAPHSPRLPATHRRPARRSNRRFPVYAIL